MDLGPARTNPRVIPIASRRVPGLLDGCPELRVETLAFLRDVDVLRLRDRLALPQSVGPVMVLA
jgi:hypothetical protein